MRKRSTPAFFICRQCKRKFPNPNWIKEANYCSQECYQASGGPMRLVETRKKMGLSKRGQPASLRGKKHHWWKGGVADRNGRDKYRTEIREWRYAVLERDGYECKDCGKLGTKDYGLHVGLDVAHVKSWEDNPALRFKVSNGITLCRSCHMKRDEGDRVKWGRAGAIKRWYGNK